MGIARRFPERQLNPSGQFAANQCFCRANSPQIDMQAVQNTGKTL
jgi:hypothetical protein